MIANEKMAGESKNIPGNIACNVMKIKAGKRFISSRSLNLLNVKFRPRALKNDVSIEIKIYQKGEILLNI